MATKDKSLLQFLKDSGEFSSISGIPMEALLMLGNTPENASGMEIITISLSHPREEGEITGLAAIYLIRSGYEKVAVAKQAPPNPVEGFAPNGGFTEFSLVVGENSEDKKDEKVFILVGCSDTMATIVRDPTD